MNGAHEYESELPADICTQFITTSNYLSILKQLNIKQLCPTPTSIFNQTRAKKQIKLRYPMQKSL